MKLNYKLINEQVKQNLINCLLKLPINTEKPLLVTIQESKRTLEQNAKMWAMLSDISQQVVWHGSKLTSEEWKHIFSATIYGQKTVPNLEGNGFVVMGKATSNMTISKMAEMIELMTAFGVERGVEFKDNFIYEGYSCN